MQTANDTASAKPAPAGSRVEPMTIDNATNAAGDAALGAGLEMSKLGSKSTVARTWVTGLIIYLRSGLRHYAQESDSIMATWAKRDDSNEIVTEQIETKEGKGVRAVMKNEIEAQLARNELLRRPMEGCEGTPPRQVTLAELDDWFKDPKTNAPLVSPELASRLGPWLKLT